MVKGYGYKMTKQDFLNALRLALGGKQSSGEIQEHINYYEEYINTEIRKGRDEEEVLASLGDPRLIARTIVQTADMKEEQCGEGNELEWDVRAQSEKYQVRKLSGLPGWIWLLLVLIIIFVILGAVFSIVSALLPVAIPILIIWFVIKMFRDGNH